MKHKYICKLEKDKEGTYFKFPKALVTEWKIKSKDDIIMYYKKGSGKIAMKIVNHWILAEFK